MGKSRLLLLAFAILVLSMSCAPSVSRSGDYGRITVAFGDASSGRFLEGGSGLETGWPGGSLPAFSSVTVTVSAADMSTVTTTASLSSGTLTVQVPAGVGRLVQLVAVPAANSTAPYFAKSYSGSASVDVGQGETKSVTITLGLEETKIPLCSPAEETWNWYLAAANSLTETPAIGSKISLYFLSDIDFDSHGRLFVSSDNYGIQSVSSLTGTIESNIGPGIPVGGLAYQKSSGKLFYITADGHIGFVDTAGAAHETLSESPDPRFSILPISAIAADETGIYVVTYGNEEAQIYVAKLDAFGTTLTLPPVTYTDLNLDVNYHCIYDMTVKDGVLYLAASYMIWQMLAQIASENPEGRGALAEEQPLAEPVGKIIALDASTLKYLWEVDWPTIGSLEGSGAYAEIYFGPLRFLGFTKNKLYLADAGLQLIGQEEGESAPEAILGRVVEIDTERHTMSATGFARPVIATSLFPDIWD